MTSETSPDTDDLWARQCACGGNWLMRGVEVVTTPTGAHSRAGCFPISAKPEALQAQAMDYEVLNLQQPESEEDPFTEDRYRQFYRHLPPFPGRGAVLDLGCNTGRGGAVLKGLAPHLTITGLDAVEERLRHLPDAYSRKIHGYSTNIPASDYKFDAIVSGEFLEHVREKDVGPTLAECFRVLQLRGRLLLTTPNPGSMKRRLRGGSVLTDSPSHVSQHFPDMLRFRLRMAGFSNVRILGSGQTIRYLGEHGPLFAYGSYLAMGDKW